MTEDAAKFIANQQEKIGSLENPIYMDKRPDCLQVKSLQALVNYIYENKDGVKPDNCIIVIESINKVVVYSQVQGAKNNRHPIVSATPMEFNELSLGRDLYQDQAIIQLQTRCERTPEIEELIQSISGLTYNESTETRDDGVKNDINLSGQIYYNNGKPKTVTKLKPFRIYPEVDQPASQFLLRISQMDKKPTIAIHETDGGMWKIQAVENIIAYLRSLTASDPIVIIG